MKQATRKRWIVTPVCLLWLACNGGSSASPEPHGPGKVINVVAAPGPGAHAVTVSWDAVEGATSYDVYFSTEAGVTRATGTRLTATGTSYHHVGLAGGTYHYVVTAETPDGQTADSTEASAAVSRVAFVTSVHGKGKLALWADAGGKTGLAAGDEICRARVAAAGLGGTFVAWLSDQNDDAYCRVQGLSGKRSSSCGQATLPARAGPWVRTDLVPFGGTIDRLLPPTMENYAPLVADESGQHLRAHYDTGTNPLGEVHEPLTCADWTTEDSGVFGAGADTLSTMGYWSSWWGEPCSQDMHILCFETGAGPALPPVASSGRRVFMTSTTYPGDLGGPLEADAKCQSRAISAGLANTSHYKAWISTATVNAADRLTSDGPWFRPDGMKVADSKADLLDGELLDTISQTETGAYLSGDLAWTGTGDDGTKADDRCSDWSATTGVGMVGRNFTVGVSWSGFSNYGCSGSLHLYCFED